ncbi:MAG TPA: DUF4838 domain-containing protein, partial [Candidatus Glassbacteria bacterium]|nr:DUF4838 domain-containing protein [Candidatus Glassbacteria bacterium]
MHWDTKHHQKRPETLRRLLDWYALFKVNMVGFEIEDKYEFPSHPVIGAPGAYTKAEMQELTRYALERHIQIVPQVQAPAHLNYVLKHPEFAHLKADGSNYQACMCDEEAIQLILDLYQDMIDATPGVDYFHVSTDEIYYAGICEKCKKLKPYNEINRSQTWVDYVNRVHAWMRDHGRRMLCWVEYPLLAQDIHQLPAGLIDAITVPDREPEWVAKLNKAGIGQLAYTSIQGAEYLFPNLFPTRYRGGYDRGRLEDARTTVQRVRQAGARPIGSFCAAWDDSGLHEETFMLGWAAMSAWAW